VRDILRGEIIFDDTAERIEQALVSRSYQLTGKPDHVIRTRDGNIVPVERKTGAGRAASHGQPIERWLTVY
jgi:hypothetical protein